MIDFHGQGFVLSVITLFSRMILPVNMRQTIAHDNCMHTQPAKTLSVSTFLPNSPSVSCQSWTMGHSIIFKVQSSMCKQLHSSDKTSKVNSRFSQINKWNKYKPQGSYIPTSRNDTPSPAEIRKVEPIPGSFFLPYPSNSASLKVKSQSLNLFTLLSSLKPMSPANFPPPG